jgi:hypothetical protein
LMHWEWMDCKTKLTVSSSPLNTRPDRDLQDLGGATLVKQVDCRVCICKHIHSQSGTDEYSKTSPTVMKVTAWSGLILGFYKLNQIRHRKYKICPDGLCGHFEKPD